MQEYIDYEEVLNQAKEKLKDWHNKITNQSFTFNFNYYEHSDFTKLAQG